MEDTVLDEDVEQSFQSFSNENFAFEFSKCDMIIDYRKVERGSFDEKGSDINMISSMYIIKENI